MKKLIRGFFCVPAFVYLSACATGGKSTLLGTGVGAGVGAVLAEVAGGREARRLLAVGGEGGEALQGQKKRGAGDAGLDELPTLGDRALVASLRPSLPSASARATIASTCGSGPPITVCVGAA